MSGIIGQLNKICMTQDDSLLVILHLTSARQL